MSVFKNVKVETLIDYPAEFIDVTQPVSLSMASKVST